MTKHRAALILVVLLLIVFAGWWELSAMGNRESSLEGPAGAYVPVSLPLVIHHTFSDGADIYSGTLVSAAGCGALSSGIAAQGSSPVRLTLMLSLTKNPTICRASNSLSNDFSLSYKSVGASPMLSAVIVNGDPASYSVIEDGD